MKIVIDIDEEVKNRLRFGITYSKDIQVVCEALNDGTPLPKGHGRLIDADALNRKDVNCANVPMNFIDTAPTIIEADKEKKNDDS